MAVEKFLIDNGLQLFKERYPRHTITKNWNVPKEYTHSVIGCKVIFLKNLYTNTSNKYTYKIDMWFDEAPMITLTLYDSYLNSIIEETVVFANYKYDTMLEAVEILMGSFKMSLDAERLTLI